MEKKKFMRVQKFLILFLILLLSFPLSALAQQQMIKGQVVDDKGETIIGATVMVKGSKDGTLTDIDGNFSVKGKVGNTLVISYVGFTPLEIKVTKAEGNRFTLKEDTKVLDEVVVVGMDKQKRSTITAAVATVGSDAIVNRPVTDLTSALQGNVAGLNFSSDAVANGVGGETGAEIKFNIRGIGSMNTDSQPLYVVDGMFFDNIDFLNNSDIQDLSILKDASAASIYGVRAANGVVLVTTKKGALNRPATVTYDGYVGFQKATNVLKMANSEQYATMISEMGNETLQAVVNNAKNVWGTLPNTNWYDEILHTALTHNHSLDISGGTEKATYSVGTSYLYQDGILDSKNDYSRFNLRTKADYKAFDWLKVGANVVLSNSTQNLGTVA